MFEKLAMKSRQSGSLRQWGMELLVVVFGVLLALWTQEWVSNLRDRESAQIAAAAMDRDLLFMATGTMRRFTAQPCMLESLRALVKAADIDAGEAFTAPPVAKASDSGDGAFASYYPVPLWSYPTMAFDRAVATGAFNSMSHEKAAAYAEAYDWVQQLKKANAAEEELNSRIALVSMVEEMDSVTRLALRRDIAELDGWNQSVLNSGRFLFDALGALGLQPDAKSEELWAFINTRSREVRGECVLDIPLDFTGRQVGKAWSHKEH